MVLKTRKTDTHVSRSNSYKVDIGSHRIKKKIRLKTQPGNPFGFKVNTLICGDSTKTQCNADSKNNRTSTLTPAFTSVCLEKKILLRDISISYKA